MSDTPKVKLSMLLSVMVDRPVLHLDTEAGLSQDIVADHVWIEELRSFSQGSKNEKQCVSVQFRLGKKNIVVTDSI